MPGEAPGAEGAGFLREAEEAPARLRAGGLRPASLLLLSRFGRGTKLGARLAYSTEP